MLQSKEPFPNLNNSMLHESSKLYISSVCEGTSGFIINLYPSFCFLKNLATAPEKVIPKISCTHHYVNNSANDSYLQMIPVCHWPFLDNNKNSVIVQLLKVAGLINTY